MTNRPPEMPQLPSNLLDKLDQISRMIDELRRDLTAMNMDPVDDTVLPLWKNPINKKEIDAIVDAITGLKDPFARRSGMKIDGVEMTQSIQFYDLHGQGSGDDGDNTVPLVAGKDLILRVYVEKRAGSFIPPQSFNGVVTYQGKYAHALNGPRPLKDATELRRNRRDDSLNFRIPAAHCHGTVTFNVRVYEWRGDSTIVTLGPLHDNYHSATYTIVADFRDIPRMKITGVLIRFTGNGLNLPSPNGVELVDTMARFLPMLPIPGFDYNACQVMDYDKDMLLKKNWDDLLTIIQNLRSMSTIRTFFIGLFPTAVSTLPKATIRGIGYNGSAISSKDDTRALSHELGHACLLRHINQGGAGAPFDDNYPKYKNVSFGSIGEVGIDTARLTLYNPTTSFDFMTYNENGQPPPLFTTTTWISPYNYKKIMFALRDSDGTGDFPLIVGIVVTVIAFNFRAHRDGGVEIRPSYPMRDMPYGHDNRETNNMRVELYDRAGELLGSHRCHVNNPYQDVDGPYVDVHEVFPWPEGVGRVVILREGRPPAPFEVGDVGPRVDNLSVTGPQEGISRVEWSIGANVQRQLGAAVRYTNDGGRTWHAVAADLRVTRCTVNLDLLPGGEDCRFQVIVSTGLTATTIDSQPFRVPRKPRRAIIVSPREGQEFQTGEPIAFSGAGHSPDFGTSAEEDISWVSSVDCCTIGTGSRIVRDDLPAGKHRVTMTTRDGQGSEASASVWIRVLERPADPIG